VLWTLPLDGEGDSAAGDAIPRLPADVSVLRAARSLYVNRRHEAVVAERIARASAALRSYLIGTGLARVQIGLYLVELVDGEILVTRQRAAPATQLRLWRPEREQTALFEES